MKAWTGALDVTAAPASAKRVRVGGRQTWWPAQASLCDKWFVGSWWDLLAVGSIHRPIVNRRVEQIQAGGQVVGVAEQRPLAYLAKLAIIVLDPLKAGGQFHFHGSLPLAGGDHEERATRTTLKTFSMVPSTSPPYLFDRCPSLERISVMNYAIDLRANDGHLFVTYANAQETGPSASVWMVPAKPYSLTFLQAKG
jgi:hypothetical protein